MPRETACTPGTDPINSAFLAERGVGMRPRTPFRVEMQASIPNTMEDRGGMVR